MDNKILRKRTIGVIIVTVLMMAAEIYFGIITNSMALTADGFHMGTHAVAFLITLIVCIVALKYEDKTEKLNALGGYTSAIFLGLTSLGIIWESGERFFNPLSISFEEAITVAVIGLVVNLVCIFMMGGDSHLHFHKHDSTCGNCSHDECHEHHHHNEHHENLNYKAAYFHILADAMTSLMAIFALLCAKYFGWTFLDSVIGVLGGVIIAKWSYDLLKNSSKILLGFDK
jgi:cation diffusion facilitator family transporter